MRKVTVVLLACVLSACSGTGSRIAQPEEPAGPDVEALGNGRFRVSCEAWRQCLEAAETTCQTANYTLIAGDKEEGVMQVDCVSRPAPIPWEEEAADR